MNAISFHQLMSPPPAVDVAAVRSEGRGGAKGPNPPRATRRGTGDHPRESATDFAVRAGVGSTRRCPSSESGRSLHRAILGALGIGVLFFAVATGNVSAQEHVIKDEPAPKVHRDGPSEPIADGHDLPEMEVDRWGSREAWELGIGLAAVGVLLVVAFLRWQARAIRRG